MRRLLMMCAVLLSCASSLKAQTALCESFGKAYRECRIASSGRVQLVMDISEERLCFEGLTWGTSTPGVVWVKDNCRGKFTVTNTGVQPLRGRNLLVCESTKGNREICTADASNGVLLTRQLSKAPCVQGESWGADPERDLIWVDYGCRAEFLLGRTNEVEVAPPYLDSVVVCESDGRRRNCAADTTDGVQIVRQLSDKACGFGREWGYDGKGIWVTKGCRAQFVVRGKPRPTMSAIVCASENGARKQCPAETRFGVAIIKQISERECVLGTSWGFDETGVWVADGCHGQFALGGYRLAPEAMPPTATKLTCESLDGGHKHCPVDTSRGVGLIRQISDSDCILNRTWAYDRNGIWVTNGCRAEFAVAH